MSAPSAQCSSCGHIPEEDLFVAPGGGETGVVCCDGEIEDFVAMGGIGLDQARGWGRGKCFERIIEIDRAVRGAGEDLGGRSGTFGLG